MQSNLYLYELFNHWFRGGNVYVYSDTHFRDMTMYSVRYQLALRRKVNGEEISEFEQQLINLYERKTELASTELLDLLDTAQVKSINKGLGKNDTIVFLGDMIEKDHIEEGLKYCSMIKGYKVLIKGNHDAGNSNYKRVVTKLADAYYTCKKCGNTVEPDLMDFYNCGDEAAYCQKCHSTEELIYHTEVYADNHLFDEVYPGVLTISDKVILSHQPFKHEAIFNIHGHVHENGKGSDHSLNVAAEWIGYKPISLLNMFKTGKFKTVDDIHRLTADRATERKNKRYKNY